MKDPAITRRPSSCAGARTRLRQMRRRAVCAAGIPGWLALERVQFLALVAAPARNRSQAGSNAQILHAEQTKDGRS
jgi:hypothetical protein